MRDLPRQSVNKCFLKRGNLNVNNYSMFEKITLKKRTQKQEQKGTKQVDIIKKQRHPINLWVP